MRLVVPRLGDLAQDVRSKNAGPFTVTMDIFCGADAVFERIRKELTNHDVARLFATEPQSLRRFELPDLRVVKFSMRRPQIQGSLADRDMHAAQFAELLREYSLPGCPVTPGKPPKSSG